MYLCDYCGNETSHKASAVKKHVEAVRDEAKGVCPDPIEELDEGEGEIKKKKAEKIPRVGISKDEANPVALQ